MIFVHAIGGILVGIMAPKIRLKAIRGHGIPEAMEQVLENNSRIPARVTILKPISAAIAIGTGGPFGAEGPIIATGGALGSVIGQAISTTAAERKTLLAAGAASGMAAIFGSPISAVLLAVELLLFEYRARSIIPVALASVVAAGMRIHFEGAGAIFAMPNLAPVSLAPLALYSLVGLILGVASVGVTRIVYWIEDMFDHLPIHWMWWPAIGACGHCRILARGPWASGMTIFPTFFRTGSPLQLMVFLCTMKFVSWSIALSSGTSGGTLAPLLTIGGGGGGLVGSLFLWIMPGCGIDIRVAALVGMAAMFAGASRAFASCRNLPWRQRRHDFCRYSGQRSIFCGPNPHAEFDHDRKDRAQGLEDSRRLRRRRVFAIDGRETMVKDVKTLSAAGSVRTMPHRSPRSRKYPLTVL